MRSKKALFLDWLDRQDFEAPIVDFEASLISGAEAAFQFDTISAESFAEGNLDRYWNFVLAKMDADRSRGITPLLQVADSHMRRLRWAPIDMIRAGGRSERRRGSLLQGRPEMLRRIDSFSHRQYEALGCVVCELVGASRTHLTPPGNEGGIDFLALMPVPAHCHLFGPQRGPLRIVGQSKRHETPVSLGDIRDFVTTMDNVRKRQLSVEPHIPAWFRAARGPVLGFICGHRGFQSGAESFAQDHGITTADSLDLAEAACMARHVPESANAAGRAAILAEMVQRTLSRANPAVEARVQGGRQAT